MPPLDYLVLRLLRRHLPQWAVRRLLARGIIIRPGLETREPAAGVRRFMSAIRSAGQTVVARRILIFGYGGRFEVGIELLRAGARHVVLVDPYAVPASAANLGAESRTSPYLRVSGSEAVPDPRWLSVITAPLGRYLAAGGEPADLVLSNSVMEHVDNVAGTVLDLARATASGGHNFHFIDLRDHFFKHPFEMLCYSEAVWHGVLNPGSNLNRLRSRDYESAFAASFRRVKVDALYSNLPAFRAARPRIRPEFLTGDEERDAVTHILLHASQPDPQAISREPHRH